ncbi:hypothetical protein LINPERHAP2_LOCUS200 [Linum perenne]
MDVIHWILKAKQDTPSFNTTLCVATLWCIWRARNDKTFNDKAPHCDTTISLAVRLQTDWERVQNQTNHSTPPLRHQPPPPPASCREILCDGAFSQNLPRAGYGIVIRDSHGAVVAGYAGTLVCSSPIVAEAKALLLGISTASASDEETIVKTDCLELVDALRKPSSAWPWQCAAWIHTMSRMLAESRHIRVSFTPRAQNHLADKVAKAAANDTGQEPWVTNLPFPIFDETM